MPRAEATAIINAVHHTLVAAFNLPAHDKNVRLIAPVSP